MGHVRDASWWTDDAGVTLESVHVNDAAVVPRGATTVADPWSSPGSGTTVVPAPHDSARVQTNGPGPDGDASSEFDPPAFYETKH
jgi:hypothetical protein